MKGDVVFLDKDGTLIEDRPYNVDPELIRFAPGVVSALRRLHAKGYLFIIVTNQSGVAKGMFDERSLANVERHLHEMMRQAGIPLSGFYYCPHHPDGRVRRYAVDCTCRKPMPGMLFRAARERDIRLKHAWFVGDTLDDVEAGRRAGCKTILLNNGHETVWRWSRSRVPHAMVEDFRSVADTILASAEQKEGSVCL
jgi:D-glycero-D-manno-heptose 1,7-bisphosphate phosphatase